MLKSIVGVLIAISIILGVAAMARPVIFKLADTFPGEVLWLGMAGLVGIGMWVSKIGTA